MSAYVDVEDQHWGGAAPSQFTCTQRPWNKDDPAWINSKDINVEGFSISAMGKPLFENADLKVSHPILFLIGRLYLVDVMVYLDDIRLIDPNNYDEIYETNPLDIAKEY